MVKIAVLVSGGGTNLQALIDAGRRGALGAGRLTLCVSSKEGAYALQRAADCGMQTAVLCPRAFADREAYGDALIALFERQGIDLVVLAGFLVILPNNVIARYRGRMVNIHPSLIPSFCGAGFYGLRVHEAALAYGVKVTGATAHLVSEEVDGGRILLQKAVSVEDGDTPELLQKRVMEQAEWVILPAAVAQLCDELNREKGREA